jgi:hypothetical protein
VTKLRDISLPHIVTPDDKRKVAGAAAFLAAART